MTRRLINLINNSSSKLPANVKFCNDVTKAIEQIDMKNSRRGSNYYKPSCLHCQRQMYFIRGKAEQDISLPDYQMVGMANTGTIRHEFIQNVLLQMKELGFDWEYINVENYIKQKQSEGKCKDLIVTGTRGFETHLIDNKLKLSFMCDGIVRRISTNEYYLFEFKNVTSFKFYKLNNKALDQHMQQVTCYCNSLDLDKVFLTYENRDVCMLEVPEIVEITDEMKEDITKYLIECEEYYQRKEIPPKTTESRNCRYCQFKTICKKV